MARSKFFGRTVAVCGPSALWSLTSGALNGSAVSGFGFVSPADAKVVIQRDDHLCFGAAGGLHQTNYGSVVVWKCGTKYYQSYNGRYVVVYVKTG
jgi:hypothetical protein